MLRILGFAVVGVLAVAGCSGGGSDTVTPSNGGTSSAASSSAAAISAPAPAAAVKCSSLVGDPNWAAKVPDNYCTSSDGTLIVFASFKCKDGSGLFQFDDGQVSYYGLSTRALVKTARPAGEDPGYKRAFFNCT